MNLTEPTRLPDRALCAKCRRRPADPLFRHCATCAVNALTDPWKDETDGHDPLRDDGDASALRREDHDPDRGLGGPRTSRDERANRAGGPRPGTGAATSHTAAGGPHLRPRARHRAGVDRLAERMPRPTPGPSVDEMQAEAMRRLDEEAERVGDPNPRPPTPDERRDLILAPLRRFEPLGLPGEGLRCPADEWGVTL